MTDRAAISLDGTWEFLHSGSDRPTDAHLEIRTISVPGPWQAQFPDLRTRAGIGIYRRAFDVPQGWRDGRVFLNFGAVFHHAKVWVNGMPVGSHEGGFLPFRFDVTEALVEGQNEVKVRAESPTDNPLAFPDAPFAEIPFGKQSWYGPLSGIWQSVTLERRSPEHITASRIIADAKSGEVSITLFLNERLTASVSAEVTIIDPMGRVTATRSEAMLSDAEEMTAVIQLDPAFLWSPDDPQLYRLEARLNRDDEVLDIAEKHFGFRTIETRDGHFYLNGEPLYLRGALDQDYYPDGICTAPSPEFIEDQFRKAKELGLNCLRCHIKAADPRYYDAADRIGLLIWTELPNGGMSTERSRARKERLLRGIVDRDRHHPSIIIWTIINENWGVDLVHDPDHRAWLKRTYHWLKAYDPQRLVVDNSPLAPSFHVETDIADYHFYAGFPDHRAAWDEFVDDLAARREFLYSQEGDAVIRGDEPVICSEFGNWGLPNPRQLTDGEGREPWWFETGHDWGEGVMYAHGVENRFMDWSLDRPFGTLDGFVEAAQRQQFRALKYEIEAMRRKRALAGYVITEFTDAHWESNGLLDMRRNRRVFHDEFSMINADTVIVPDWTRLAAWSGEAWPIGLAVAHGGGDDLPQTNLMLRANGDVRAPIAVDPITAPEVADLGVQALNLPQVMQTAIIHRVALDLRDAAGQLRAHNYVDVAVYPERQTRALSVWSADLGMLAHLEALGYRPAPSPATADAVVATRHDRNLVQYVREGGRLLLLPEEPQSLYPFFPHWQNVNVKSRDGTLWAGDWASSFAWLTRQGPFAAIPGGPLIDETMDRTIPSLVIAGCNLLDFQARVHAGLVVGWIHKPVALTVERAYGKGRLIASTFTLFRDPPGFDPAATTLLDAHLDLLTLKRAMMLPQETAFT